MAAVLAGLCLTGSPGAQSSLTPTALDLVELDVVVTDNRRQPISNLTKDDFEVRQDGKLVEIKTFLAAVASGSTELDQGRSMVILLDDVTLPPAATNSIKSLAGYLVTRAGPGDEVSVVRLNNRNDEPYGDFQLAIARITEYQARIAPFDFVRTTEDALKLIAAFSKRLEINGRRRKAIVCLGTQRICNIQEPVRTAPGSLRADWIAAVSAAARANVSVYALTDGRGLPVGGIVEATGGEMFRSRTDLTPAIERIWRDLSHHYLVGYWPTDATKDLHSISVKVKRRGARVLVRKTRGN